MAVKSQNGAKKMIVATKEWPEVSLSVHDKVGNVRCAVLEGKQENEERLSCEMLMQSWRRNCLGFMTSTDT